MEHRKLALHVLVILLVVGIAGVSAGATDASSAPSMNIPGVQSIAQAIPIPGWQQVNSNGFGDPHELEVSALEAFNGYLYAGTHNVVDPAPIFDGARIFRSPDGVTWTPVTQPGFQDPHDSAPPAILDFVVFGNRLYASTGRGGNAAQIWRASNGVSWAPMVAAGFGDPDIHDIAALAVYNGVIYAGASSQVSGARIFRSSTGDSNTWNPIAPAAPTMAGAGVTGFAVFNGALWATIESEAPVQIWRSTGDAWTTVVNNGFGNSLTTSTGGMAVFGGYLYVGAGNSAAGAQLWRSNNGTSWAGAINPGFGDSNNQKVEMVFVFQNQLYVSVKNAVTGMEVWRSADGTLWEQVNQDGFGDSNNFGTNGSKATADFLTQLYVGTSNVVDGGELWRMLQLNAPPTDISLSNATVDENQPINTVVGALTATDPDHGATATVHVYSGGVEMSGSPFTLGVGASRRVSFVGVNSGPVQINSTNAIPILAAERVIYSVNGSRTSFSEMMSLPASQLDTTYWLPWYNNVDLDTQLRFGNVSGSTATVHVFIGGVEMSGSPFTLGVGASRRVSFAGINNGPVKIVSDVHIVAAERVIYNVNGLNTSFSEMMGLPNSQLDTAYWLPWYNNVDLDTQLRFGNVSGATFTFSLACTVAGADDGAFNILGTNLRTSATFDYETKSAYNICLRVTDQGGLTFDKNFVVTVNNLNEASNTPGKVNGGGIN